MGKENPVTWRDTVSGQLRKYPLMQGPAPLKKIFFQEIVVVTAFLYIIAKDYCQMETM